jgi:hypothetical protein
MPVLIACRGAEDETDVAHRFAESWIVSSHRHRLAHAPPTWAPAWR